MKSLSLKLGKVDKYPKDNKEISFRCMECDYHAIGGMKFQQQTIAMRVIRRTFPKGWPITKQKEE